MRNLTTLPTIINGIPKRIRSLFTIAVILLIFASSVGCGTMHALKVTYDSVPEGATIIRDGHNLGGAPVSIYYKLSYEDLSKGYYHSASVEAYWPDGVGAYSGDIKWDGIRRGDHSRTDGSGRFWFDRTHTFFKPKIKTYGKPVLQLQRNQEIIIK